MECQREKLCNLGVQWKFCEIHKEVLYFKRKHFLSKKNSILYPFVFTGPLTIFFYPRLSHDCNYKRRTDVFIESLHHNSVPKGNSLLYLSNVEITKTL